MISQAARCAAEVAELKRMARAQTRIARCLATAALLCWAYDGYSQDNSIDREIKAAPGREVRVGIYSSIRPDCTAGPLPAIRLAVAPEHGTVTVRRAMLKATNVKQCLAVDVPAFVAFYRASQDLKSQDLKSDDRFELEVSFAAGRKQLQHFHVSISNAPNDGQRI
jgi:hypothetical protein